MTGVAAAAENAHMDGADAFREFLDRTHWTSPGAMQVAERISYSSPCPACGQEAVWKGRRVTFGGICGPSTVEVECERCDAADLRVLETLREASPAAAGLDTSTGGSV